MNGEAWLSRLGRLGSEGNDQRPGPPYRRAADREVAEMLKGLPSLQGGKRHRAQRRDAGEPPHRDTPDHGLAGVFGS
jgi:hypothetical protein